MAGKVPDPKPEVAKPPAEPEMAIEVAESYLGQAEQILQPLANAKAALHAAQSAKAQAKYFEGICEERSKEIKDLEAQLADIKKKIEEDETKYKNQLIALRKNYDDETKKLVAESEAKLRAAEEQASRALGDLADQIVIQTARRDALAEEVGRLQERENQLKDKLDEVRRDAARLLGSSL